MASSDESSNEPGLQEHPLVARTTDREGGEASTVKLIGYLGRDAEDGFWRVYFTPQLETYVRVREQDVIASAPHPAEQGQLARSVLYVTESGDLEQVTPLKRDMQAGFLGGQYVAGMSRAAPGGATPAGSGGDHVRVLVAGDDLDHHGDDRAQSQPASHEPERVDGKLLPVLDA